MFYANEAVMITLWSNTHNITCSTTSKSSSSKENQTNTLVTYCVSNGDDVLKQFSMNSVTFFLLCFL